MVAFTIICTLIVALLSYNTFYWTTMEFTDWKDKTNLANSLKVAYIACYTILFTMQFLVWVAACVIYCMLKYYLYPMKLLVDKEDALLEHVRKRNERITKFQEELDIKSLRAFFLTFIVAITLRTTFYMSLKFLEANHFYGGSAPQHDVYVLNIVSECVIAVMLSYFIWKSAK